jgi:hypothetical protein
VVKDNYQHIEYDTGPLATPTSKTIDKLQRGHASQIQQHVFGLENKTEEAA